MRGLPLQLLLKKEHFLNFIAITKLDSFPMSVYFGRRSLAGVVLLLKNANSGNGFPIATVVADAGKPCTEWMDVLRLFPEGVKDFSLRKIRGEPA